MSYIDADVCADANVIADATDWHNVPHDEDEEALTLRPRARGTPGFPRAPVLP